MAIRKNQANRPPEEVPEEVPDKLVTVTGKKEEFDAEPAYTLEGEVSDHVPDNDPATTLEIKPEIWIPASEPGVTIDQIPDPIPTKDNKVVICISDELHDHYKRIIETRDAILDNPEESGQAQAAIINATTTALKELLKTQQEAYNSDTIARLQQAVINALGDVSKGLQEKVIKAMEGRFGEIE